MNTNPRPKPYPPTHRGIGGVCGGIAEYFGLDTSTIRIVTLILILFGGLSLWVYILLWIIIPNAPDRYTLNR